MPNRFQTIHFHVAEENPESLRAIGSRSSALRGIGRKVASDKPEVRFNTDEAAARFFLSRAFDRDARSAVRGLTAPERAELVPDMRLLGVQEVPQSSTRMVRFEQIRSKIPIFGSLAVVELDQNRELVSVNADVAEIQGVSPIPYISVRQALESVAGKIGAPVAALEKVESPELTFYHDDDKDIWHLAYFVRGVEGAPTEFMESVHESRLHGLAASPRSDHPTLDYLVDAHSGAVLFYYSATPLLGIPSKCKGLDEEKRGQEFLGCKAASGFQMADPMRSLKTYDLEFKDLDSAEFPKDVISSVGNDWSDTNRAAVSAHVNAARVYDFYNSVLKRDGINGKGMDLISVVHCTYGTGQPPETWANAVWYKDRMWYGQVKENGGGFNSFSRYLDVIAHELTHGVTQYTADLVYSGQSGALNESMSDIFGIIIKNWFLKSSTDVSQWEWELGPGLGKNGLPLRDLSNPKRTGDPDHMDQYLRTFSDSGGVHTNSNIHNKAAYNVLTAVDENGAWVFTPSEVATLYYLCLSRLSKLANFSRALQALLDVANTYYAGDEAERQAKTACIKRAYEKVGIN